MSERTTGEPYNYHVSSDEENTSVISERRRYKVLYNGPDIADAMGAFSRAIGECREYVIIEALRLRLPEEKS